jgi:hypothetical protein
MKGPGGPWAAVNAALLAARALGDLPEEDARALLALLHVGTLVEADAATMRALDLERLACGRQLAGGALAAREAECAAIRLLALGHRDPARGLMAGSPSTALVGAWADWTGEGPEGAGAASCLTLEGLTLVPAASRGELRLAVTEPMPARLALRRLRVGATVLDVDVRPRAGGLRLGIARTHGPALVVTADLPARFESVAVDDVEGLAPPLRFELRDRHEVVAYG